MGSEQPSRHRLPDLIYGSRSEPIHGLQLEAQNEHGMAMQAHRSRHTLPLDPLIQSEVARTRATSATATAELFWQYTRAEQNWRRHSKKPVRRVRRFLKRKGKGKWRAKGKGKCRYDFLEEMQDPDEASI